MSKYITKDSGRRETFSSGMVRDTREGKGRYDLVSPFALERISQVYERGAAKYDDWNWTKGSPFSRFLDSALRHINSYKKGLSDEDHLGQACWNLMCIMHFEELGMDGLNDLPTWTHYPLATYDDLTAAADEVRAKIAELETVLPEAPPLGWYLDAQGRRFATQYARDEANRAAS